MTVYPGLFGMQPQQPQMSPFDVSGLLPQYGLPDNMGSSPAAAPAQSFVWGGSGERLTDADIAQREQQDRQQIASGMDFSPVQSWTQGAARVAQALVAKLDKGRTDAASAANVTANNQALASLSQAGGKSEANIAALLSDATLSDGVHDYAKVKLAGLNKPPKALNEFQQAQVDAGILPGSPQALALNLQYAQNKADPLQLIPGVDAQGQSVLHPMRASQIQQQGGGDPASTVPQSPVGKLTPIAPIGGAGSGSRTFPLR
ncbi:MAG: hypothetical protein ACRYGI_11365 [Janthinobacterium lividum]